VPFASLDFIVGRGDGRRGCDELVSALAEQQPAHEAAAASATHDVVGDTEKPGLDTGVAAKREVATKGDHEHVVQQILEVGVRSCESPHPPFHVGREAIVKLVEKVGLLDGGGW